MACKDPNCRCNHREESSSTGGGFALGVAIGAAASVLLAPAEGKKTRTKAKAKLDELAGGRTPEEILEAIKDVVGEVMSEIHSAAEEGKAEAAKTRDDVMQGKHPVTKSKARRRK